MTHLVAKHWLGLAPLGPWLRGGIWALCGSSDLYLDEASGVSDDSFQRSTNMSVKVNSAEVPITVLTMAP